MHYTTLDDPLNTGSIRSEVQRVLALQHPEHVVVTQASEYRLHQDMQSWSADFALPVKIQQDDRFLCITAEFAGWSKGRSQLRMEYFYREMRKNTMC